MAVRIERVVAPIAEPPLNQLRQVQVVPPGVEPFPGRDVVAPLQGSHEGSVQQSRRRSTRVRTSYALGVDREPGDDFAAPARSRPSVGGIVGALGGAVIVVGTLLELLSVTVGRGAAEVTASKSY